MSVNINLGAWNSVFVVPTKVIDEGIKFCDEAKLKVLLYVLRNSDKELNEEIISKAVGVSVAQVIESLDYWVSFDILCKKDADYKIAEKNSKVEDDDREEKPADNSKSEFAQKKNDEISINNNQFLPKNDSNTDSGSGTNYRSEPYKNTGDNSITEKSKISASTQSEFQPKQTPRFTVTKLQKPDYVFTAQRLAVDEELAFLVNEAQLMLGKTLSNSDISTLLMLKDTCGLPLDVILMLIQYCLSIDRGNMRTIEKIGINWADDGIDSVESADNKIRQAKQSSMNFSTVSRAFGLSNIGSPTKKQVEYGDKWVGEWKFSFDMLREAYERCVDKMGSVNFRYIDGILKRWYSNKIRNISELQSFEKSASKPDAGKKASYDIDELDKIDTLDNF